MPGISQDNKEQTTHPMKEQLNTVGHLTVEPMMVCGVNRKINIGNYENIDVYVGVSLPIPRESLESLEGLREAVKEAADVGIAMASEETFARYQAIKGEAPS